MKSSARRALGVVILATLALQATVVRAETLDAATMKALEEAQSVLTNPNKRKEAIKESPDAKKADDFLNGVAGTPENAQEIYDIAAQVAAGLAKQAGGDPSKMEKILQKAQSDPEGFANTLAPADRARIKELAGKIEAKQPKQKAP